MNHDCCSPTNKKEARRGGIDSFIVGIIIVTVFILGGAVYFGTKTGAAIQVDTDRETKVFIDSNKYDWGMVDYDGGIVSKSFSIKNAGSSVLKLYDVTTSCMCTTAQLKSFESTSKKYGMHEKSTDVFEIKPGETAELIVEFDPAFHGPSGVGPISRTVTMNTNDAKNPILSFSLTASVVKK